MRFWRVYSDSARTDQPIVGAVDQGVTGGGRGASCQGMQGRIRTFLGSDLAHP